MVQTFKILETGNVYFPLRDIGKKFTVIQTITFEIDASKFVDDLKKLGIGQIWINEIYRQLWKQISEDKKFIRDYRDCWLCPIRIDNFMGKWQCIVDVLKPVRKRWKKKY
jgi:hypothetical protein